MNNISQFQKCANCGACVNICPVNAIHVERENLYYSLYIDESRCITCGKCTNVCPVNTPLKTQKLIAGYIGYVEDNAVLFSSSSGGLFYAIAQLILDSGGIVFGAAFAEDQHSVVFRSTDDTPLCALQKSKYVESDIGDSFRRIKMELINGRNVLFCGTPCQAAGLKRFLGIEYDNLIVCDFSCGGLPSHQMYDQYLQHLEEYISSKVKYVDFRPKNYGWNTHSIYIKFKNGRTYTRLATLDPYYKGFLNSLTKRDYCYECDFSDNHASDIILADFWLHKCLSDMDNHNRGLSLVLTNSEKGERIMQKLMSKLVLQTISLEEGAYNIKNGHYSQKAIDRHMHFVELVKKKGFFSAINIEVPPSFRKDWKQWVKQLIKRGKYEGSKETRG